MGKKKSIDSLNIKKKKRWFYLAQKVEYEVGGLEMPLARQLMKSLTFSTLADLISSLN